MSFLVQINLEHLPQVLGLQPLPSRGTLSVFYDAGLAPMAFGVKGYEPSPVMTGDAVKVICVAEDVADLPPRTMPPIPDLFCTTSQTVHPRTGCIANGPLTLL